MAKMVMRLEADELRCFHANYIYMWKKLNTAPYYVSGYGESPSWIRGAELLPSYVNLSKCMSPDYVPSVNLVNKIVHFYNANIAPAIDTYSFLHDILESGDKGRTALVCASSEPYCGLYYGYYYSETDDECRLRGALLRLFESDGELRARLICEIIADEDMQRAALRKILNTENLNSESFSALRNELPLSKRLMALYIGAGKASPGVVSIQMQRTDRDGEYLSLFMPISSTGSGEFIGGLGVAFLVTPERTFQFFRAGFERADINDLSPLTLGDTRVKQLLALEKGSNERITMSASDNTAWTNYIVLKHPQA